MTCLSKSWTENEQITCKVVLMQYCSWPPDASSGGYICLSYALSIAFFRMSGWLYVVLFLATRCLYQGHTSAFWLTTECRSRAYAILICLSVVVVVVVVIVVVCEHSSWPHAWPNKVHTLHAHAAISCIVAYQKLYHSDLYLLYSSHICMFILMSIVHKVINIATSN